MVKVTDRWYIAADSNCYKIQEKTKVQDENSKNFGQEVFKDMGYYSSIEGCIEGILKSEIREYLKKDEENSIKDLFKEIKSMQDFLKEKITIKI